MKPLQFNKNSWHYKLVSTVKDEYSISDNFCEYFWDVIGSLVLWLSITFISITGLYMGICSPLIYLAVALQYGWFELPKDTTFGLAMDSVFLLLGLLFYVCDIWIPRKIEEKRKRDYDKMLAEQQEDYVPKQPGFIITAWRTFKDKTCFKIEFK